MTHHQSKSLGVKMQDMKMQNTEIHDMKLQDTKIEASSL